MHQNQLVKLAALHKTAQDTYRNSRELRTEYPNPHAPATRASRGGVWVALLPGVKLF